MRSVSDETFKFCPRTNNQHSCSASLVTRTGSKSGEEATMVPSEFFADVAALLERLDSADALRRACVAAVGAALPSLDNVRELLEARFEIEHDCFHNDSF